MDALEELAERLGKIETPPTFYLTADAYHRANDDLAKAKQIIAELAKVQPDYVLNGMSIESLSQLENTYANIRAIAEKGAEG